MKICFICSEYPPGPHGGVGSSVQMLARGLVLRGHHVNVIGIYPPSYPAPDQEVDHGVNVERLRSRYWRFGWLLDRYDLFIRVRRLVQDTQVQIIEGAVHEAPFVLWPSLGVPCVIRAQKTYINHVAEFNAPSNPRQFWLEGLSLRRANHWIASSRFTAEITRRIHNLQDPPYGIIYNAVAPPPTGSSRKRKEGLIVFAGTLTSKKGIVELIRAFNILCETRSDAELEVYGKEMPAPNGQPMLSYLAGIQTQKARSKTSFHGHVARERMFERFQTATMAVFPSYGEAFGFVAVEAMSMGCPVIYTKNTCGPEIVDNGVDGLLINPKNPEEIASAITTILEHKDLAAQLGIAALNKVAAKFSMERWLNETEAFYKHAIRATV